MTSSKSISLINNANTPQVLYLCCSKTWGLGTFPQFSKTPCYLNMSVMS